MGHGALARLLIDRGSDPGIADVRGRTALNLAERNGHTGTAEILRRRRADAAPPR